MLKATSVNASKKDLLKNLEGLESGSDEEEEDEMTPAENDVKDLIKQAKEGINGKEASPIKKVKGGKKGKNKKSHIKSDSNSSSHSDP